MGESKSWSVSIPQGVREVIGRRLDHLSPECNQILSLASVIGREFSLAALLRLGEVKEYRLLEILEDATAARIAGSGRRGRYLFSHALIRGPYEAGTTRRVRLHRQIAEALGPHCAGRSPTAELASLLRGRACAGQGDRLRRSRGGSRRRASGL
jgi:predicted ATPase